jgi:hypothetical protein
MKTQTENEALDLVEVVSTARELRSKLYPYLKEELKRSNWQQLKDMFLLRKQDVKLINLWNSLIDIEEWAIKYRYDK